MVPANRRTRFYIHHVSIISWILRKCHLNTITWSRDCYNHNMCQQCWFKHLANSRSSTSPGWQWVGGKTRCTAVSEKAPCYQLTRRDHQEDSRRWSNVNSMAVRVNVNTRRSDTVRQQPAQWLLLSWQTKQSQHNLLLPIFLQPGIFSTARLTPN